VEAANHLINVGKVRLVTGQPEWHETHDSPEVNLVLEVLAFSGSSLLARGRMRAWGQLTIF
jgi:hypothetical protein